MASSATLGCGRVQPKGIDKRLEMSFLSVYEVPSIMVRSSVNCSAAGSHLFGIVADISFEGPLVRALAAVCQTGVE
jgi:hypothetical protein